MMIEISSVYFIEQIRCLANIGHSLGQGSPSYGPPDVEKLYVPCGIVKLGHAQT